MEWWMFIIFFIGGLFLVMSLGLSIAFSFFVVNLTFIIFSFGLSAGSSQIILSTFESLVKFTLTPVPLFILMGDVLMRSGIVGNALDSISKWMGKVPGRLSLISLAGGALFSNLSGSAMANTALLGSTLLPEMQKRGYRHNMTFGPIMAAAGLAIVIPPSTLAVLLGSLGKISVGPLLIAGIIPGLLMAATYVVYVIVRCKLNPDLAPAYDTGSFSMSDKLVSAVKYILPLGFIVFMVLGMIFLGVATPTEAAALGALGSYILALCYSKLNRKVFAESLLSTLKTTGMIMFIIAGASAFTQLLALTGATREVVGLVTEANVSPMTILVLMLLVVFIMGIFLEQIPIMMLTLPFFMPVVIGLDFNPIWFGVLMLIMMEIGTFSPPFGMVLFVMKGVSPKGTKMAHIYSSAIPFVLINIVIVAIIILFPAIATWLPDLMFD